MSNNVSITSGSGTTIATDQLGTGEHVQLIKVLDGTEDSANRWKVNSSGAALMQISPDTFTAVASTISSSGNNTVLTPSSGKAIRLHYVCLSASTDNTSPVTASVKFNGGSTLYKVSLYGGSMFARNIGAGNRYLQGSTNQTLVVDLSTAQSIHVNVEYEEI